MRNERDEKPTAEDAERPVRTRSGEIDHRAVYARPWWNPPPPESVGKRPDVGR